MADIDFAQLCSDTCWDQATGGMISLVHLMEDPQCAATFAGDEEEGPNEEPDPDEEEESDQCLFDMCADPTFQMICNPDTDLSVFNLGPCMVPLFRFVCDSICHASCQLQDAPARQVFCSPETHEEEEEEEDQEELAMSPDSMADMFNFMCLYNPNKEFYCQQKGMEWEAAGAFEGGPVDEFPDPCNIDCSSPTGQAIAELGCCMAGLVHISEKAKMLTLEELRVAKAAMHHCGGDDAFNFCSGKSSGMTAPAELIRGSFLTDACPTSRTSEGSLKAIVADELGTRASAIDIVACVSGVAGACGGRRLGSGVSVDYTVTLMGSNASMLASQKERLEVKQKTAGHALESDAEEGDEEGDAKDTTSKTGSPAVSGARRQGAVASVCFTLALLALAQR